MQLALTTSTRAIPVIYDMDNSGDCLLTRPWDEQKQGLACSWVTGCWIVMLISSEGQPSFTVKKSRIKVSFLRSINDRWRHTNFTDAPPISADNWLTNSTRAIPVIYDMDNGGDWLTHQNVGWAEARFGLFVSKRLLDRDIDIVWRATELHGKEIMNAAVISKVNQWLMKAY